MRWGEWCWWCNSKTLQGGSDNFWRPILDPWIQSRDQFLSTLSAEEKQVYDGASLTAIVAELDFLQAEHEEGSRSRNVSEKIRPFTTALRHYEQALDVFVNAQPMVMSPLWGGLRVLLKVSKSDYLKTLYAWNWPIIGCCGVQGVFCSHLHHDRANRWQSTPVSAARKFPGSSSSHVGSFAIYSRLFQRNDTVQTTIAAIYLDIFKFCVQARKLFKRNTIGRSGTLHLLLFIVLW